MKINSTATTSLYTLFVTCTFCNFKTCQLAIKLTDFFLEKNPQGVRRLLESTETRHFPSRSISLVRMLENEMMNEIVFQIYRYLRLSHYLNFSFFCLVWAGPCGILGHYILYRGSIMKKSISIWSFQSSSFELDWIGLSTIGHWHFSQAFTLKTSS